ncbi:MAG: hypothetical protein R6V50_03645 [Thermoplasmatota archaeon]
MKEGYLQEKMREFDYKLKQQMDLALQLDKHLQRIIVSEKEQKKMFKKLHDLDTYRDEIKKQINREIRDEFKDYKKQSKDIILHKIDDAITKHMGELTRKMENLYEDLQYIKEMNAQVMEAKKNAIYSQQLCMVLIEELIRERVFSREKIEIIMKRAGIRANDLLKK